VKLASDMILFRDMYPGVAFPVESGGSDFCEDQDQNARMIESKDKGSALCYLSLSMLRVDANVGFIRNDAMT
jgi:hypothetical protein